MDFVRSFAWLSLLISSALALISLLNLILLFSLFDSMQIVTSSTATGITAFVLDNVRAFGIIVLIFSLSGVVGAIGLLRSRSWGFAVMIPLLSVGILWGAFVVIVEIYSAAAPEHGVSISNLILLRSFLTSSMATFWMATCAYFIYKLKRVQSIGSSGRFATGRPPTTKRPPIDS